MGPIGLTAAGRGMMAIEPTVPVLATQPRILQRGWRAVQARVSETGDLVDVCTGTGAGQNATREYYLNRPSIFGPDDRGGAMALTAALEMHALSGAK